MYFEKTFSISVNNISLNEGEDFLRLINSRFRILALSIKRSSPDAQKSPLNSCKKTSWGWDSGL